MTGLWCRCAWLWLIHRGAEMTGLAVALCVFWNGDAQWSGPLDVFCVNKLLAF